LMHQSLSISSSSCVVTLAEIRFGIERVTDAARRIALHDWLANKVRPMFDRRVLPITEEVRLQWRVPVEEWRKLGHTFSQPDLFIAATAIHHELTVITRDRKEFDRASVPVVNPWEQ
jgi:toxin FitB